MRRVFFSILSLSLISVNAFAQYNDYQAGHGAGKYWAGVEWNNVGKDCTQQNFFQNNVNWNVINGSCNSGANYQWQQGCRAGASEFINQIKWECAAGGGPVGCQEFGKNAQDGAAASLCGRHNGGPLRVDPLCIQDALNMCTKDPEVRQKVFNMCNKWVTPQQVNQACRSVLGIGYGPY